MKLTAQLKLQPTSEQHALLRQTLEAANAACNYTSDIAWEQQVFGQFALHTLCYGEVRARFGLGADAAVRVFAKVADAYKLDRKRPRAFRPHGAFPFNDNFVEYKAQRAGVPVRVVDPRNTSRTCPACGHVEKANRLSQDKFLCTRCGCAGRADYFAAVEIGRRAEVRPPNIGSPV